MGSAVPVLAAELCIWWWWRQQQRQQQQQVKDTENEFGEGRAEREKERERNHFLEKLNGNMPFPNGLQDMAPRMSNHETPSKDTLRRAVRHRACR